MSCARLRQCAVLQGWGRPQRSRGCWHVMAYWAASNMPDSVVNGWTPCVISTFCMRLLLILAMAGSNAGSWITAQQVTATACKHLQTTGCACLIATSNKTLQAHLQVQHLPSSTHRHRRKLQTLPPLLMLLLLAGAQQLPSSCRPACCIAHSSSSTLRKLCCRQRASSARCMPPIWRCCYSLTSCCCCCTWRRLVCCCCCCQTAR